MTSRAERGVSRPEPRDLTGAAAAAIAATRVAPAPLPVYFALTFLVAWAFWLAAAAVPAANPAFRALLFLPGTFAPALVALALTGLRGGRDAVGLLVAPIFAWRVGAHWYLFALGYMAAVKLAAGSAHAVVTGSWPGFTDTFWPLLFAAAILGAPFQVGEELGWRGYALPRLAGSIGLAAASLLLGLVWALWHLPLFYLAETGTTGQSFPQWALGVVGLSVALAWLWGRTGGSLLLVMLMHAAINNTKGLVPTPAREAASPLTLDAPLLAWLTTAALCAGAVYFLLRMPRASRAPGPVDTSFRGFSDP